MMQAIKSQFGHPRGLLGRVVGTILAFQNRERIAWTVAQLKPQATDHLLEIGFGPGVSTELLAQRVTHGRVAGVDISEVMVQQASRRNAAAIRSGHVDLRQGVVSALPYDPDTFDTVLAINSLHHWNEVASGLREAHRVLKTGGTIAIIEQPPSRPDEAQMRERGAAITTQLQAAGFHQVTASYTTLQRGIVVFVQGVK